MADSQSGPNLPKSPRKSFFLTRISPFVFPNLTKPWGGWVQSFGKVFPNKTFFFFFFFFFFLGGGGGMGFPYRQDLQNPIFLVLPLSPYTCHTIIWSWSACTNILMCAQPYRLLKCKMNFRVSKEVIVGDQSAARINFCD